MDGWNMNFSNSFDGFLDIALQFMDGQEPSVYDSSAASPSSSSASSSHVQSSLQARHNWPGNHNFLSSFDVSGKTKAWAYCDLKDKLFVRMDESCPVNFTTNGPLVEGVTLRAMAMFRCPEDAANVVKRCHQHSDEDMKNDVPHARHLVRCESEVAVYEVHPTTHHFSVVVPWENPHEGEPHSTYIFRFACLGSCRGGPNRRPLSLVFTLEKGNQVLGRRTIQLKICASPVRDCSNDMKAFLGQSTSTAKRKATDSPTGDLGDSFNFIKDILIPDSKKKKPTPNKDGKYTLSVRRKDDYDFLQAMGNLYDLCKIAKENMQG